MSVLPAIQETLLASMHDTFSPPSNLPLALLGELGDGITITDRLGRIVFCNGLASRILALEATNVPDAWGDCHGVFLPDERTPFPPEQFPIVRALRGERTHDAEMFVKNPSLPDGASLRVTGHPLRDQHGAITGSAVLFHDVTRLRRTERQLASTHKQLHESRLAQKEFNTLLVHDLQGPLTQLMAHVELLLDDARERGQRDGLLDIKDSAESMQRMILELHDTQLAEDGMLCPKWEPVELSELLIQTVASMTRLAAEKQQTLDLSLQLNDPAVHADGALLRRVLQNLIGNSIQYCPLGTRVLIEASPGTASTLLIRVRDQGPGIPRPLRHKIFEKYARLDSDGVPRSSDHRGLGLYFARLAIQAHHGRIWVEDNHPRGACFCISLSRNPRPTSRPSARPCRVLSLQEARARRTA